MERVKRICSYLAKMKFGAIRYRTEEPDFSSIPNQLYDWTRSVYGDCKEVIPEDAPEPLGKPVLQTTYVDANLAHNYLTGKSVTGILHLLNQTPVDSFSKHQATAEVATYGSEFSAARSAVEQMFDIRLTLRYLGVPVRPVMYLFGDNSSVVTSCTVPDSRLKKRHHLLSYHFVREAIASGVLNFVHVNGSANPADILSKHWGYQQIWPMMKPLLFWSGDTAELLSPCKNQDDTLTDSPSTNLGSSTENVVSEKAGKSATSKELGLELQTGVDA